MSFADLWRLFSYSDGRSGRLPYWMGVLILSPPSWFVLRFGPPMAFLILPLLWFWACMFSKRLHDFGRAGTWMILPVIMGLVAQMRGIPPLSGPQLVWLAFVAGVGLMPGQKDENRFGPAPGRGVS